MKSCNNQPTEARSKAPDKSEALKGKVPVKPACENRLETLPIHDAEKSRSVSLMASRRQKQKTAHTGWAQRGGREETNFLNFLTQS